MAVPYAMAVRMLLVLLADAAPHRTVGPGQGARA